MFTIGLLGFVGALIGTEIYTINAEFSDLLCGYIAPFAGCFIGWLLVHKKK